MISLPEGTQVCLAAGVTDIRHGMYGLSALDINQPKSEVRYEIKWPGAVNAASA